jgi:hypothetical protein
MRLGARGRHALSRLLTPEELPFDVLGIRIERAYASRKDNVPPENHSKQYKYQIIAERSIAILGINRFVNIALRPYASVEEVGRAHSRVAEIILKRFAHMRPSQVTNSEIDLHDIPHLRLVVLEGEYMGDNYRIMVFASIVVTEMLYVEFQSTASSAWEMKDCEYVLRLQLDKLNR